MSLIIGHVSCSTSSLLTFDDVLYLHCQKNEIDFFVFNHIKISLSAVISTHQSAPRDAIFTFVNPSLIKISLQSCSNNSHLSLLVGLSPYLFFKRFSNLLQSYTGLVMSSSNQNESMKSFILCN